jgi:DNA-directed RNA polymerase specialized sigma subunit
VYLSLAMTKQLRPHQVNVRMTKKEFLLLKEVAMKLGVSQSDIIRLSLRQNARRLRSAA